MNQTLSYRSLRGICGVLFLTLAVGASAQFKVGLVSDGAPKPNSEAAYNWAKGKFDTEILPRPKSKNDLLGYGVVWWDESNAAALPAPFLDKATLDAFRGYLEEGGGLLLSNLAFHAIFDMGIEPGQPRYFGANGASPLDWTDFQIAKGKENHAIFKGLKMEKGLIQYDIQGYAEGSDFYAAAGPTGPTKGEVLAQVVDGHPQTNPLCEYKVGNGTAILIGWVWSSWVINKKLEDTHAALHTNIIKYLASKSKFAAVDAQGKLAVSWSELKANR